MAGVNKCIILGNVGNIESKTTSFGPVVNLSVATSEEYTNKQGEKVKNTEWHKVVCFKRLAEIVDQYVQKGHKLYVEGSLKTEKYTDKDGVEKYTTKIIASSVQLLEKRESSDTKQYQSSVDTKSYHQDGVPFDDSIPF